MFYFCYSVATTLKLTRIYSRQPDQDAVRQCVCTYYSIPPKLKLLY